jgi:hypothetical protein
MAGEEEKKGRLVRIKYRESFAVVLCDGRLEERQTIIAEIVKTPRQTRKGVARHEAV